MANSHWSQFSHNPKFFFMSAIPFAVTLPLIILGQFTSFAWIILASVWLYVIIFELILKMPLQYTGALFRTWWTGKNKEPRNNKDPFEL